MAATVKGVAVVTGGSGMKQLIKDTMAAVAAGVVGTAVMDLGMSVERAARGGKRAIGHPLDKDVSQAPVRAIQDVTGEHVPQPLRPLVEKVMHWGYGSGAALGREALRRAGVGEPAATVAFWVGSTAMAMVAFPVSGATEPPWRWQKDVLATSVGSHLVYAVTVSAALPRTRRLLGADRTRTTETKEGLA